MRASHKALLFVGWLVLWYGYSYLEFGTIFIIISMFVGIAMNLGERKSGEASAYSVFNSQFRRLLGDLDWQEVENSIRHTSSDRKEDQKQGRGEALANHSTASDSLRRKVRRNDECICGSTLKFKRCCGNLAEDSQGESDSS